jgi:uncharacterized protein DUF6159
MNRIQNGWKITLNSFKILKANQKLIVFPILSGISIILIMASFFTAVFAASGWHYISIGDNKTTRYFVLFLFYVMNYFVVVFFNMALIHCTHLYFKGEEVTVKKGLQFSLTRIGTIFIWALFAGTVGFLLKIIQQRSGIVGKVITGLVGIVWSIATFFVVPVIAYENVGPIDAIKRSSQLMKQKWGETLTSRFSFALIQLCALVIIVIPSLLLGTFVHPVIGIAFGALCFFVLIAAMSAVQTIFVSAIYHNVTDEPVAYFDEQLVDNLFQQK